MDDMRLEGNLLYDQTPCLLKRFCLSDCLSKSYAQLRKGCNWYKLIEIQMRYHIQIMIILDYINLLNQIIHPVLQYLLRYLHINKLVHNFLIYCHSLYTAGSIFLCIKNLEVLPFAFHRYS